MTGSTSQSLVGRSGGPYHLTGLIGAGGMGEVNRAEDATGAQRRAEAPARRVRE